MYQDKRILAIIPARGGSKEVPRKNILEIAGKPLIAWTIEEAKKSKYIDRLILSSDDEEIISIAKDWKCEVPFIRPKEFAKDDSSITDPILHAINQLSGYNYVVALQPTTPLRTIEDIDGCLEFAINNRVKACASMTEPSESPYWMYKIDENHRIHPLMKEKFTCRQLFPKFYVLNGAIYIAEIEWIKRTRSFLTEETVAYLMPQKNSFDIDTILDMQICEKLLLALHS